MIIEKFQPILFHKEELNLLELDIETGVKWEYASSGKAAFYHCLKSLHVKGKILIPVYICSSILEPLARLNLEYSCYDINVSDLNADINDLESKIINGQFSCVLVASMYGNPANMSAIESLCRKYNLLMIDDAAQSFVAKFDNKYVGTFGDAGFFSFSPGKATSGHLGAFFWTSNSNYKVRRKNNYLLHKLAYLDFFYNRYHIYKFNRVKVFKILKYLKYMLFKFFDTYYDKLNEFEKPILGGILVANKIQQHRNKWLYKIKEINFAPNFDLLTLGFQNSNNHKIVIKCRDLHLAQLLKNELFKRSVYSSFGYKLLNNGNGCPNSKNIDSKIIELPLEADESRMNYLIENLKNIIIDINENSVCNNYLQ